MKFMQLSPIFIFMNIHTARVGKIWRAGDWLGECIALLHGKPFFGVIYTNGHHSARTRRKFLIGFESPVAAIYHY